MIDSMGLIVQENGDGGDCPNRTGTVIGYFVALDHDPSINNFISSTQKYLMPWPNVYWRYPKTYPNIDDFSRDQASRLMLAYGMAGRQDLVKGYYSILMSNGLKHQNGDYIGTGEPGNIIRSLDWYWLWPLLFILDIKFLYDVLIGWRIRSWDYDNLFLMDLWFAKNKFWTPWAWLSSKLYDKALGALRVQNNLNGTGGPGLCCKEALVADLWFIQNI